MDTDNPALRNCPTCGANLSPANLDGLCPRCVARSAFGLDDTSELVPKSETLRVDGSHFPNPRSASIQEKPGEILGHYHLIEKIGQGGFGEVWLVQQQEPVRRQVALKVLKLGMDTQEVITRFEAERQALALMDHPNIAKVFDGGATQTGRPYFVMELVRGIRITDYCDQKGLGPRERLQLFIQVCQAVQHAHQKGIIHRDLKPSNILVSEQDGVPVPKVIDFGIAKATEQQLTEKTLLTRFSQFLGTPAYISPEQAGITGVDVDTRSDIYSLGVVLYELLVGRTPFDTTELMAAGLDSIRRAIREQDPPRPSTRLSTLSEKESQSFARHCQMEPHKLVQLLRGDLDWVVMKCLEKERGRRYQTVNGLASDIQRYLSNEPVLARPPSKAYQFRKLVSRNKIAFAAGAAVFATLILGLALSTSMFLREKSSRKRAVHAEAQTREALRESYLAQASANRSSGRAGRRFESLDTLRKAAAIRPGIDLQNEAIACLALPDLRKGKPWSGSQSERVAFDHAFSRYAQGGPAGIISVHSWPDHKELFTTPEPRLQPWHLVMSDDARFLGAKRHPNSKKAPFEFQIWDVENRKLAFKLEHFGSGTFSPDGRTLAYGEEGDGGVIFYAVPSGKVTGKLPGATSIYSSQFSPDGTLLAVCSLKKASVDIYRTNGELFATLPHPGVVRDVAWHPDGNLLATACSDHNAYLWDLTKKEVANVLRGHENEVTDVTISHAGDLLVTGSWDGSVRLWDVQSGAPLVSLAAAPVHFAFSPDDRLLSYFREGNQVGLLDVATGRECRTFGMHPGGKDTVWSAAISPDGTLLATSGDVDGVRLWDLATGKQVAQLQLGYTGSLLFHPSGDSLLTSSGSRGLKRWPIKREPGAQNSLLIGPPQQIETGGKRTEQITLSADGEKLLAEVQQGPAQAVVLGPGFTPVSSIRGHTNLSYVAISPDGKLVATGTWRGTGVKIWQADTGKFIRDLPVEGYANVAFSPNGQWLVTATGSTYEFWNTQTWSTDHRITRHHSGASAGEIVFSADSRMVAITPARTTTQLMEIPGFKPLATLQTGNITPLCFSPDSATLVTAFKTAYVQVWDLRGIRQQLSDIGLDWELPPSPPQKKLPAKAPLHVKVIYNPGIEPPKAPAKTTSIQKPPMTPMAAGCVDLSRHLNASLEKGWIADTLQAAADSHTLPIPAGTNHYGGVLFDVRGVIQLGGSKLAQRGVSFPKQISDIEVRKSGRKVHILHGTDETVPPGTIIGFFILRYQNLHEYKVPIIYGDDVLDWWFKTGASQPPLKNAALAWTGTSPASRSRNYSLRVYRKTIENPFPEIPIQTIDYTSTMTDCAPFLLGITLE